MEFVSLLIAKKNEANVLSFGKYLLPLQTEKVFFGKMQVNADESIQLVSYPLAVTN